MNIGETRRTGVIEPIEEPLARPVPEEPAPEDERVPEPA
jgi:hypothetical protein